MSVEVAVVGDFKLDSGVTKFIKNIFQDNDKINYTALNISGSHDSDLFLKENHWKQLMITPANQNYREHISDWRLAINKLRGKCDLVYFNYSASWNILPIWLVRSKLKVPIVVHAHNTSFGTKTSGLKKEILLMINRLGRCYINNIATIKMAASVEAAHWVFGKKSSVKVVNNGVDLSKLNFNEGVRRQFREKLGLSKSEFVIGNVGVLEERKNQSFLLDVFKKIRIRNNDAKLWIFGEGSLKDELQKKVCQLGLNESVTFWGKKKDLTAYYQAMDVFIMPSKIEGLSVSMVEAEASGLPIVINGTLPTSNLPNEHIYKISLEQSTEVWARKILDKRLFIRKPFRNEMAIAGFDKSIASEQVLNAILGVISNGVNQNTK